jgi:probable addiction module antidote protein
MEMKGKMMNYDPAEDLGSEVAIAAFMAEAFQINDAGFISHALGVVARAKGRAQIGIKRADPANCFTAPSVRMDPTLKTTRAVMSSLGIMLSAKASSARG